MQFNRLSAFTLGVIITAASVGAVSFANAAGDATLKACANKTSGAMRYISKGSCKKTEKLLSWSQMGPQGLPGVAGADGTNGTEGTKGATGANGQNFHAIDATGKDLGIITQGTSTDVTVSSEGGLWNWSTQTYAGSNLVYIFRDSLCTVPLGVNTVMVYGPASSFVFSSSTRWILAKSAEYLPTAAYKSTGQSFDLKTLSVVYIWDSYRQTCTSKNPTTYFAGENVYGTDLINVPLPTYTPPLTIVAK